MLVLSRRVGQVIVVGQNVRIELLEVRGKRVRLGIAAAEDVPIHREEVRQRIKHSREARENNENVVTPRSTDIDTA